MWARAHEPKYLYGKSLNPNISDAIRYNNHLNKLIEIMTDSVEKELKKFFKTDTAQEYYAMDDTISSQARILTNALIKKFDDMFTTLSKPLAEDMVNDANKSSGIATRSSFKQLSGGLSIKTTSLSPETIDILNASITENVALIKSISSKYLNGVQQAVMRSITMGGGLRDLIPYLQKSKEITYRRARVIAYDQTRKAFNSISVGRMNKLGVKKFKWLHSGGSNAPRKLHIKLSGQIFSLDDLPVIDDNTGERGIPGQLINCRCRMLPIISFKE
jgi:SPP1 gp7 family putative phage head morphogenesis protein